jgi:hypothetical protein
VPSFTKLAELHKKCIRVALDLLSSLLPFRSRSSEKPPKTCKIEENQCWRVKINFLRCHPSPNPRAKPPPLKWPFLGFGAQNPKK